MSQYLPTRGNKHPKVASQNYLYTDMSPFDNALPGDIPSDIEDELRGNIRGMRREFKHTIKRMKRLYSDRKPEEQRKAFESRSSERLQRS